MRRISRAGNDRGYILLDAIIALFITSIAVVAVFGFVASVLRLSGKSLERAGIIIEKRNLQIEKMLHPDEE